MSDARLKIIVDLLNQAQGEAGKLQADLKGIGKAAEQSKNPLTAVKEGVSNMAGSFLAAGGIITGFAVAFKQAMQMGEEGAQIIQLHSSFDRLTQSIGVTTDILGAMQTAAHGTVDDEALLASTTTLLSGTTGALGRNLAEASPELVRIAGAAAKLNPMLGDTQSIYNRLAEAIKRGRVASLAELGLTIDKSEAQELYAASLGQSADGMATAEQKQALLNAVLASGSTLIDQVGGDTTSATDSFKRLTVATGELGDA